jgi:hypothetical protein
MDPHENLTFHVTLINLGSWVKKILSGKNGKAVPSPSIQLEQMRGCGWAKGGKKGILDSVRGEVLIASRVYSGS